MKTRTVIHNSHLMKTALLIVLSTLALAPLLARAETTPPQTFAFETYAGKLIHGCNLLNPDNKKFGGHMHAGLRILAGAADYALYMKDTTLFDQVNAIYQNVMTIPGARLSACG